MQFIVIGLDGTDDKAPERRAAARPDHISMGDKLLASGSLWYGTALLHDDGTMKGSMYVLSFPSEQEFKEWFGQEPYIIGKVWKDITVHKSNTREPWQFSRPKEFYLEQEK